MTIKRWQWVAAGIMMAGGLAGAPSAQERLTVKPQEIPHVQAYSPAPASTACCARTPFVTFWQRSKSRLEKCFVSEGPDPVPLGTSVYQTFGIQTQHGIAARMILYDFDFEDRSRGRNLSPRGQDQLSQVVALAMRYPYPVIIERDRYQPKLAEERREAVLKELRSRGIPLSAERIVVGQPLTPGLSGVEALLQYDNLLQQTQNLGMPGTTGAQGSSGTLNISNTSTTNTINQSQGGK